MAVKDEGKLYAITWDIWRTNSLEPCSTCGPLNGNIYRRSEGPIPPLHEWCKCTRHYHHTTFERIDPDAGTHP